MNERAALFANVLNAPADDTARLVLADWLDEHDETDFARFLRAGVTAARFRDEPFIDDPDYYAALADLAAVTTGGSPARWLAELRAVIPLPVAPRRRSCRERGTLQRRSAFALNGACGQTRKLNNDAS